MKHKGLFLLFTILLTLFAVSPAAAQQLQKFHVESFGENPFDMSAREKPTARDDGTGVLYSIIKVTSTDPDDDLKAYKFNFNYLKDVREMHDGILWVYVQNGAKTVDITRDGFHTIKRYNLETTLQPGKVYDMVLKPEPKVVSMQFLMFEVTPADCKGTVMFTEEGGTEKFFGQLDADGIAAKMLVLGKYYYRIISENYHPSEGVVTLAEPDGKHIEPVTLRPNFAHITLTVDNGAEIYINKEKKGVGNWSGNLTPGTYNVECRKANHKSTTETITVIDGKNTTYTLKAPTPIVGGLVVNSTPMRAKVLIDGEVAGETPLIKKGLLIGNHKITLSKEGYESATFDILISENENIEKSIELKKIESPVASQGNAKNGGNGNSANLGSKTSAPYKVGDYYNDGTKEGIVFAVSNSGYSGKIVSLEHNKCKWSEKVVKTGATSETDGMYNMQKIRSLSNWQNDYPAFAWCASLGDGWYLPVCDELKAISAQCAAINNTLKAKGKPELKKFWHWSSTQYNELRERLVYMYGGSTGLSSKDDYYYVRAVSAFGTEDSASSAQSLSKTSAPYKVGDYYNDGTKEGIVFEVSNGGYNGKIVSLEENEFQWSKKEVKTGATSQTDGMYNMRKIRSLRNYPAFAWCASLGEEWYLPALKELTAIYAKRAAINNTLKAKGKPELSFYYWSSTQDDRVSAWFVYMDTGNAYRNNKFYSYYVRAVSAF